MSNYRNEAWVRTRIETEPIYQAIRAIINQAARPMTASEVYQSLRKQSIYEPYASVRPRCMTLVTYGYVSGLTVDGVFAVQAVESEVRA